MVLQVFIWQTYANSPQQNPGGAEKKHMTSCRGRRARGDGHARLGQDQGLEQFRDLKNQRWSGEGRCFPVFWEPKLLKKQGRNNKTW